MKYKIKHIEMLYFQAGKNTSLSVDVSAILAPSGVSQAHLFTYYRCQFRISRNNPLTAGKT